MWEKWIKESVLKNSATLSGGVQVENLLMSELLFFAVSVRMSTNIVNMGAN